MCSNVLILNQIILNWLPGRTAVCPWTTPSILVSGRQSLDHIVDLLPLTLGGDFLETLQCSDELLFVLISDSAFHSLFHPVDDLLDFIYEVEAANSFLKALLRVELLSGRGIRSARCGSRTRVYGRGPNR